MGVFHFMGLGHSPGAVTAAISYLADRYERWNDDDEAFFSTSGEFSQEGKRGDVQALVLFTTPEVFGGEREGLSSNYIENKPGFKRGMCKLGDPIPRLLKKVLPKDLPRIAGGRKQVLLYWCECDRADLQITFERVVRVMNAANSPGDVGKEIWVNLTGGSNIINLALQTAAALLRSPARLYYLVSEDVCCLYHTTPLKYLGTNRDRFWVDIPLISMNLNSKTRAILELLEETASALEDSNLLSRLKQHSFSNDFQDIELQRFRRDYLKPMAGQRLLKRDSNDEHTISTGQQWKALKYFYQIIEKSRSPVNSTESTMETDLGALAKHQDWFHKDVITLY